MKKIPSRQIVVDLLASGQTRQEIADKYGVEPSAIAYTLNKKKESDSEIERLINSKGYSMTTLSKKMGYAPNTVSVALRKGITITLLACMAKELDLTDNQIAKIVKGEMR